MREIIRQKIVDGVHMPIRPFVPRDVRLPRVPGRAVAIVGMRRVGKTTLLHQILQKCVDEGTPREALLFFSFEDERLLGLSASDLHLLLEEYYTLFPHLRDRRKVTLFLDEIQIVDGWETFVRRLLDSEEVDIYLSGSSSRLLSREIATSMRGRAMEFRLYPFSFREYLRFHRAEPDVPVTRLPKAHRSQIQQYFERHLVDGGFPEVLHAEPEDRVDLLRGYVDIVLLRDVIERYRVSHPIALRWLARLLLSNPAGAISVNRLHNDLRSQGFSISKETVYDYVGYLQDVSLVHFVEIEADSERQRLRNPRKVYPNDVAWIPLFDRTGRANVGHALETAVFLDLLRRRAEVTYVKSDGYEVDFLARYRDHEELIQACAYLDDPDTREREVRALLNASQRFPQAKLTIVVLQPPLASVPEPITMWRAVDWFLQSV